MKYCYIDEDNFKYFSPLLSEDQQIRMMSDPSMFGLGSYDKDTACGIVLYTINEELMTFRIIYVAVSMSYQRKGVASGLISTLAYHAYEEGYITLSNFFAKDNSDPVYAMFDSNGDFSIEQVPGGVYVIDYDGVRDAVFSVPAAELKKSASGKRVTLSECSDQTKKIISNLCEESGINMAQIGPFIDENLSYAVLDKDDAPTAFAVISHDTDHGQYEISYIMTVLPDQTADLVNILTLAITDLYDQMDPQEVLRFSTPVGSVERLVGKYFKKDYKTQNFYLAGYNGDSVN